MKKITAVIALILGLTSCGSSEVVRDARKTVNGDWSLTSVDSPGVPSGMEVTLLQDGNIHCFLRSDWTFVSNNNTGSYILEGNDCDGDTRFFTWSLEDTSDSGSQYDLLLKPTDANHKSTTGNQGFRFNLITLTQTEMVWEQNIMFEGDSFTIRMNFNKNQKNDER